MAFPLPKFFWSAPPIHAMRARFYTLAFLLFALNPQSAFPHPHVFIDNTVAIVFDGEGLAGFRLYWLFDEMFSNMLIHDYDKNGDGKFEEGEIKGLKRGAFSNLKKFNYFIRLKVNGKVGKGHCHCFSVKTEGEGFIQ